MVIEETTQGESKRRLAFSSDGRLLASGSEDGTVRLWDVEGGTEWRVYPGLESQVRAVAFLRDGRFVTSSGKDVLRLWDVKSGECRQALRGSTDTAQLAQLSFQHHPWLPVTRDEETVLLSRSGPLRGGPPGPCGPLRSLLSRSPPIPFARHVPGPAKSR